MTDTDDHAFPPPEAIRESINEAFCIARELALLEELGLR
jgi:hypothetical protein